MNMFRSRLHSLTFKRVIFLGNRFTDLIARNGFHDLDTETFDIAATSDQHPSASGFHDCFSLSLQPFTQSLSVTNPAYTAKADVIDRSALLIQKKFHAFNIGWRIRLTGCKPLICTSTNSTANHPAERRSPCKLNCPIT